MSDVADRIKNTKVKVGIDLELSHCYRIVIEDLMRQAIAMENPEYANLSKRLLEVYQDGK